MNEKVLRKAQRNNSIDFFRLVCAVFIVAIHTHPLLDLNDTAGYYATYLFTRVGVPFFFCTSGYFYIKALLNGKKVFKKTLLRLLTVYGFWSVIYIVLSMDDALKAGQELIGFIKGIPYMLLVDGTYYHFWFFPALMFAIIVFTLFHKLKLEKILAALSILIYIIACLYYAYAEIKPQILNDILHNEIVNRVIYFFLSPIPFFVMGYFIVLLEKKKYELKNKRLMVLLAVTLVLYICENVFIRETSLMFSNTCTITLYPLVFVIICLLLNNPFSEKQTLGRYCKTAANFTYYSHPLIIVILIWASSDRISETPMFLLTCIICISLGLLVAKIDNKWLNKIAA